MPNRILRGDINRSPFVAQLSESAEILYRRLMSLVDDSGRFEDKPEVIRSECFPYQIDEWSLSKVRECLTEVSRMLTYDGESRSLVTRYEVDGRKYIQIHKFGQRVRTEKYPPPPSLPTNASKCPQMPANARLGVVGVGGVCVVGDEGVVGDGEVFFADQGFQDFKQAYPKESGLHSKTLEHWYSEALGNSPADEHARMMAGLARMKAATPAGSVKYLPSAEDFIRKQRYLEQWEPEKESGGRSEVEVLRKAMEARR
jgi:hypothetical protein